MKLSQKTFVYSIALALLLVAFFLLYMVYFLPNLYVDHVNRQNEQQATQLHYDFLEQRSYETLNPWSVQASMSLVFPQEKDRFFFYSKMANGEVQLKDELLVELLSHVKDFLQDSKEEFDFPKAKLEAILQGIADKLPFDVKMNASKLNYSDFYHSEDFNVAQLPQNTFRITSRVQASEGEYSTIILITSGSETVLTMAPVMNPKIQQILPVIVESLPMVLGMLFLMVIFASGFFSRKIVEPIVRLAHHAEDLKAESPMRFQPLEVQGEDEMAQLARSLNDLHQSLKQQYLALEEQREFQEVMLQAGSHQLKTPVAASLLLVEGMMHEVGKYKDVKAHLPQLREQLFNMQRMINSLLEMKLDISLMEESKNIRQVTESILAPMLPMIEAKDIHLENQVEDREFVLSEIFEKVLTVLIENAWRHTPQGEQVRLWNEGSKLFIENSGAEISAEDLPHVRSPFVKGRDSQGHGLGLYLADFYASKMNWQIELTSEEGKVLATLDFSKNTKPEHRRYTSKG